MFEMIMLVALSHTGYLPSETMPSYAQQIAPSFEHTARLEQDAVSVKALDADTISKTIAWRASVEQASASLINQDTAPFGNTELASNGHSNNAPKKMADIDLAYDAAVAKHGHWFELHDEDQLHRVTKESRMPRWFLY